MSDNTTPEPKPILLHADFSTTRHEQPEPGDVAEHERKRREKLSRERLLLADMDPSAAECTITQPFTELPDDSPVRDDVTPERLNAWMEKRTAALREATGFDLRTGEEAGG